MLAVPCHEPVAFQTPLGRRREEAALVEAWVLHEQDWQRLSMSEGTKGPRLFDWAIVPMLHPWEDDGRHFLLIGRSIADPKEKRYSFVFAPAGSRLPEMVRAIGAGFHIEEDFATGKDMGLDQDAGAQLHRLVPPHHAGDVGTGLTGRDLCAGSPILPGHCPLGASFASPDHSGSAPEAFAAHLARFARLRAGCWDAAWWRRVHQSWASYYHPTRRLSASLALGSS